MRRLFLLVYLLAPSACTDAIGPAPRVATKQMAPVAADVAIARGNETIPLVQTFANSCTGEDVELTGQLHLLTQTGHAAKW